MPDPVFAAVPTAQHPTTDGASAYAGADFVLCPMSEGHGKTLWGYKAARLFYKKDQLLFAGSALYGVAMNADGLTLSVDHTACGPYDDSSMNIIR